MNLNKYSLDEIQTSILEISYKINKKRLFLAYVLLIFAGFFGAHQFYLKRYTHGTLYLAILFFIMPFNFFLLFIPGIIVLILLIIDAILLPFYAMNTNGKIKDDLYLKLLTLNLALKANNNVNFNMGDYLKALHTQIKKCNKITDMELVKLEEKAQELKMKTDMLVYNHGETPTFDFGIFLKENAISVIAAILIFSSIIYVSNSIKQALVTASATAINTAVGSDVVQSLNIQDQIQKSVQNAVYQAVSDNLNQVMRKEQ